MPNHDPIPMARLCGRPVSPWLCYDVWASIDQVVVRFLYLAALPLRNQFIPPNQVLCQFRGILGVKERNACRGRQPSTLPLVSVLPLCTSLSEDNDALGHRDVASIIASSTILTASAVVLSHADRASRSERATIRWTHGVTLVGSP